MSRSCGIKVSGKSFVRELLDIHYSDIWTTLKTVRSTRQQSYSPNNSHCSSPNCIRSTSQTVGVLAVFLACMSELVDCFSCGKSFVQGTSDCSFYSLPDHCHCCQTRHSVWVCGSLLSIILVI